MDKIWEQKWKKCQKDGMRRGLLQYCSRKKRVKETMAQLKGMQIRLNRETMRMEPVQQSREV